MSIRDDSYADDDYEPRAAGGGGGAILGVLMTLVIGGGLVFAAYQLGQRTSVDEPPMILADAGDPKMVPIDAGGTPIANQDNDAYTMIDEVRRTGVGTGEPDGIVVSDRLPDRALNPTGSLTVTGVQEDALRIDELQLASAVDGEPSLTGNAVPDRTGDLELAGGAEVQVADSDAVLRAETAAADAAQRQAAERDIASLGLTDVTGTGTGTGAGISTGTGIGIGGVAVPSAAQLNPLTRATDTQVAAPQGGQAPDALTEQSFGTGLAVVPLPRSKPDLARRLGNGSTPRVADVRQAPATPPPSAATTRVPVVVPIPGQVAIAPPVQQQFQQIQPATRNIPVQPVGDAQVQLGALPTPDMVRARWAQLSAQNPQLLGRLGLQILPVRTAAGQNLFRLRVGPLQDTQAASRLCDALRGRGVECYVPAR